MNFDVIKAHVMWLVLFALGALLLFGGPSLIAYEQGIANHRAEEIRTERVQLQESAERFQADMKLAASPEGQLSSDEIERLLAPVDRLKVASEMERQASASRLSHFTYAMSPEKKAKLDLMAANPMTESDVTLAADMPLDTDAASFIMGLSHMLPGRVQLRQLVLTRVATDAPPSLANIHMEATLQWLSNGTVKDGVGAR